MSKWNDLSPLERCAKWSSFRNSIQDLTVYEQLNKTADFFKDVPIGARSVDFYTPESWPTPWEIFYGEMYCQNTISLLAYYTMKILHPDNLLVEMWIIDDTKDRFLIAVIDSTYVLNYELGAISNWQELKKNISVVEKFDDQIKQYS